MLDSRFNFIKKAALWLLEDSKMNILAFIF